MTLSVVVAASYVHNADNNNRVLFVGAVAGGETDLAQRIIEAGLLGDLCQLAVVLGRMVGALLDVGNHQAARNIRHPVGELDRVGSCVCHELSPIQAVSLIGPAWPDFANIYYVY